MTPGLEGCRTYVADIHGADFSPDIGDFGSGQITPFRTVLDDVTRQVVLFSFQNCSLVKADRCRLDVHVQEDNVWVGDAGHETQMLW